MQTLSLNLFGHPLSICISPLTASPQRPGATGHPHVMLPGPAQFKLPTLVTTFRTSSPARPPVLPVHRIPAQLQEGTGQHLEPLSLPKGLLCAIVGLATADMAANMTVSAWQSFQQMVGVFHSSGLLGLPMDRIWPVLQAVKEPPPGGPASLETVGSAGLCTALFFAS